MSTSLRTIVVEARKDPRPALMLDALADGCAALGYRVIRWRGPLSGRLPYSRWLPPCDAAILFNGTHAAYQPVLARLRAWQAAVLFVELGWFPQAGHYQIDPQGVNAAASWCRAPLPALNNRPMPVPLRAEGDLLVLTQLAEDTQLTAHSPWFTHPFAFVKFMATHSALPVRVRAHPLEPQRAELQKQVQAWGCRWDDSPDLAAALSGAKAVACINSSAAVEALHQGYPVLCYGEAVYRHFPAVYCLTNATAETHAITRELANNQCTLDRAAIAGMIARIHAQQWQPEEVPLKLPALLQSLAWPGVRPAESHAFLRQTYHWLMNLPSRILYRHRWREIKIIL